MAKGQQAAAAIERRILGTEHREVEDITGRVEAAAELAGNLAARDLDHTLRDALDAVERTFLTHTDWEDSFCYPEIDRIAGTPWATRALRFQHQQIRAHVDRLEADWLALRHEPTHRQLVDLRARLYGLAALLTAHFDQETHFVLPLLGDEGDEPRSAGLAASEPPTDFEQQPEEVVTA